jgi:hypothetical protein
LITLVSVAWSLLLSQELFVQYLNDDRGKIKRKNPPFA